MIFCDFYYILFHFISHLMLIHFNNTGTRLLLPEELESLRKMSPVRTETDAFARATALGINEGMSLFYFILSIFYFIFLTLIFFFIYLFIFFFFFTNRTFQ